MGSEQKVVKAEDVVVISLSGRAVTIVDPDFMFPLSGWCLSTFGYAVKKFGGKVVKMHRLIMDAELGQIVDHIDGDKLNNRRSNLRIVSAKENSQNRRTSKKYKGIFYDKRPRPNPWYAQIKVDGKTISLGYYKYDWQAAMAYNEAARVYFGDFAQVNMILEKGESR